jgi:hypothetical protein
MIRAMRLRWMLFALAGIAILPGPSSRVTAQDGSAVGARGAGTARQPAKSDASEHRSLVAFTYALSFPTGDLRDFVAEMTPRGFDYSAQAAIYRGLYVGGAASYTRFYRDEGRQTFARESSDVTATAYRSFTNVSLAMTSRYYLLAPDAPVRIFGGLRLGVALVEAKTTAADLSLVDSPAGLLLVPEAGATLRLTDALGIVVGYQYTFTTVSFRSSERASYHALQMGLQIGL